MRIALVCPYSLTLPGGVQTQVLALARALRALGHPTRVLGPCDGAPPDVGITPLGNSVPLAANGSMAPIAPDPACALRTIRALRDEQFDVVHLHEPLVPGPTMTALLFDAAPMVGTFHAAGGSAAYKWLRPGTRYAARRLSLRCAVSEDARCMAQHALGGEYVLVHNGIDVARFAKATPWPTEGPTIFFVGRHEPRKGLSVLLEAMSSLPPEVRLWVGGDGPETDVLRARTRRSSPVTCPATPTSPAAASTRCSCRPAIPKRSGTRSEACWPTAGSPRRSRSRRMPGPRSSPWTAWPSATWSSTPRSQAGLASADAENGARHQRAGGAEGGHPMMRRPYPPHRPSNRRTQ